MHALREGLGLREHDHRPFFRAVCCPEAMRGCGGLLRTAFNLSYLVIVVLSELRVFSERACASHVDIPLIEVLHREYAATAAEYNKLQNRISGQLRRRSQAEKSCKKTTLHTPTHIFYGVMLRVHISCWAELHTCIVFISPLDVIKVAPRLLEASVGSGTCFIQSLRAFRRACDVQNVSVF